MTTRSAACAAPDQYSLRTGRPPTKDHAIEATAAAAGSRPYASSGIGPPTILQYRYGGARAGRMPQAASVVYARGVTRVTGFADDGIRFVFGSAAAVTRTASRSW